MRASEFYQCITLRISLLSFHKKLLIRPQLFVGDFSFIDLLMSEECTNILLATPI